jgi:hypothetical protein
LVTNDHQGFSHSKLILSEEDNDGSVSMCTHSKTVYQGEVNPNLATEAVMGISIAHQDTRAPLSPPAPKPQSHSATNMLLPEMSVTILSSSSNKPLKYVATRRDHEKKMYNETSKGASLTKQSLGGDDTNMRMMSGNGAMTIPDANRHNESFVQKIIEVPENGIIASSTKQREQHRFQMMKANKKKHHPWAVVSSSQGESPGSVNLYQSPSQGTTRLPGPHQVAVFKQQELPFKQPSRESTTSIKKDKPWFQKRRKRKLLQTRLSYSSK